MISHITGIVIGISYRNDEKDRDFRLEKYFYCTEYVITVYFEMGFDWCDEK